MTVMRKYLPLPPACDVFTPKARSRFWRKVSPAPADVCWTWHGATNARGYGNVYFEKRTYLTHRVAYELTFGAVPAGLDLEGGELDAQDLGLVKVSDHHPSPTPPSGAAGSHINRQGRKPMSNERVQYDGVELDEIVAEGVTVHIEAMDAHHWMIRIYRDATEDRLAVDVHLSGNDLFEVEGASGLPVIQRGPAAYCHVWRDRFSREHRCYDHTPKRHRCTCGASKAVAA